MSAQDARPVMPNSRERSSGMDAVCACVIMNKRRYRSIRIPRAVYERVFHRLSVRA